MVQQTPYYGAPGGHYAPPPPQQKVAPVVSFREWMLTLLVLWIPLVGFVMTWVWAFDETKPNRANFCRAVLIWGAIAFVLGIVLWFAIFAAIFAGVSSGMHHNGFVH